MQLLDLKYPGLPGTPVWPSSSGASLMKANLRSGWGLAQEGLQEGWLCHRLQGSAGGGGPGGGQLGQFTFVIVSIVTVKSKNTDSL